MLKGTVCVATNSSTTPCNVAVIVAASGSGWVVEVAVVDVVGALVELLATGASESVHAATATTNAITTAAHPRRTATSSLRFEDHQGDLAIGLGLVLAVALVGRQHLGPEVGPLVGV